MKLLDTKASNWCTWWPDKWINYDYSVCCKIHDEEYWDETVDRWDADVHLLMCVAKQCKPFMAVTMFLGVRLFGWAFRGYRKKVIGK